MTRAGTVPDLVYLSVQPSRRDEPRELPVQERFPDTKRRRHGAHHHRLVRVQELDCDRQEIDKTEGG